MNYLKTHILVVEDNYQDFILFKEILSHIRDFFIQIDHADTLKTALEKIEANNFDIVFLDLFLPDSYGQDTFLALQAVVKSPVVILSGLSDRKIALDIVKQGAQDYIVKGEFDANLLEKAIVYSIERKKYQEVLEESERRNRTIFESIGIAIAEYDYTALQHYVDELKATGIGPDECLSRLSLDDVKALRAKMRVLNMNPEALGLYGCTNIKEFEGVYPREENAEYADYYREALKALWQGRDKMVYELPFINGEGNIVYTLKRWRFLGKQAGFYRLLVSTEDVSRIKENEERVVRQSSVMEGVAKAAAILLSDGDINSRINRVISIAGESLGGVCMGVYLFDFIDDHHIAYNRTHLWARNEEQYVSLQGTLESQQAISLVHRMDQGETVLLELDAVPPELRAFLVQNSLHYCVLSPFKTTVGRGCLALSYQSDAEIHPYVYSGVKTLASSVGSALATAKAQEELRQINEDLEQRIDDRTSQLRQAIGELESFSYSVSHDLRAPLRTISGFTGVLHDEYRDLLDAEGRNFLENIRRGASEMSQLIDDLLNFSRMSRRKLEFEVVDMAKQVHDVYTELRAHVPHREINFTTDNLLPCKGDHAMIRQVLVNLIWNSIKFTGKKPVADITFKSKLRDPGLIEYSISDNGVGFNMKYANKLFGVFQRLHPHEDFDGTGVGLAIIQRIIIRHGGSVVAEGEEGVGATFSFTLPLSSTAPKTELF